MGTAACPCRIPLSASFLELGTCRLSLQVPAGPPAVATPECALLLLPRLPQGLAPSFMLSTPGSPACTFEAEAAFIRTLKWLLKVLRPRPSRGWRGRWKAPVLSDTCPGAWPGQGLGLMGLTKLPPSSSFPEKWGARATHLAFCSDLERGGVGLASGMDRVHCRKGWGQEEVGRGSACGR